MAVDVTNDFVSLEECQSSVDFAETDEQMKRAVNSLSGGLAETVEYENKQTVRFIHQSVNDYLVERGLRNLDPSFFDDVNHYLSQNGMPSLDTTLSDNVVGLAHFRISRSCVKYISRREVLKELQTIKSVTPENSIADAKRMTSRFPFLQCSAKWVSHAKTVEEQRISQADLLPLFRWPSEDIIESFAKYRNLSYYKDSSMPRESLLGIASKYGLSSVVQAMIDSGLSFDSNLLDKHRQTPLSWAAENGHEGVVRQLVQRDDIDVNSKDDKGPTPLSWAAREGHEAVVRLLIERDDVDVNSKGDMGLTPLLWATARGHEAIVRLLIERDDIDMYSKDEMGLTLLSWAALKGYEAVIRLLIQHDNVNVNSKDIWGRTPLSWAVKRKREGVVRQLIKRDDVDIDPKDYRGRTPLDLAARNGHKNVVDILERETARRKRLEG